MIASVESDALHDRVVAFGLATLAGESTVDSFERLALDVARHQYCASQGFRRLVDHHGGRLERVADLPAVPTDAFRLARVATHPASADAVCFRTSGTTADATGRHHVRRLSTYRTLSVAFGGRALGAEGAGSRVVVALLPPPSTPPTSSLAFMAAAFMEAWDGASLSGVGDTLDVHEPGRWLAGEDGIDLPGLERAAAVARDRGVPALVVATGFSLVLLLDALRGRRLAMPAGTAVMLTGGFKGRTRAVPSDVLVTDTAAALGLEPSHVVGEYGMTELSSQLYEGILPSGALTGQRGRFLPPPWLRVEAADPVTLAPVDGTEPGLATFVDLANVDSAVRVVTQDLVRVWPDGVELLGRAPGAPARGCSLALEQLVP